MSHQLPEKHQHEEGRPDPEALLDRYKLRDGDGAGTADSATAAAGQESQRVRRLAA